MKRISLFLILIILSVIPCFSHDLDKTAKNKPASENQTKMIFHYHIPDEEEEQTQQESADNNDEEISQDITSDDITADTSGIKSDENEDNDYDISDMYSTVLHGYAQFSEEDYKGISLEDTNYKAINLSISEPYKIGIKNYTSLKTTPTLYDKLYSKYSSPEYSISSLSDKRSISYKGFSAGTIYNQGIDYGELEQSSGVFSRYEYKRFAITTTYSKTVNSTNNNYNDNFYIAPEFKLSQYLTLKEILSQDTVKRTKKAEFVISFNPFGDKDKDRLHFNFGASQTFDDSNNVLKNQLKFSTNYRF